MTDPISEEIARVRQELLKQHGGLEGYFRHVQKLDRTHRKKLGKAAKQKSKTSPLKSGSAAK